MYQKELDQIIKAAETFDEAIFSLADMVHWQDGALEYFIEQEILKKIKPALEAECDGCEEKCVEKVEFVDGNKPSDTRAYIVCSLRDDMGPNEVGMEKLERWKVNKDKLIELGYYAEAAMKSDNQKPARHSDDFRSVHWFGTDYSFTGQQAAAVEILWKEWEHGTPEIGGHTLAVKIDSDSKRPRDIFKGNPALGTMIVQGKTKGSYRLAEPEKS